eukprot:669651-Pleurochrysis_carterae.AAC.1
MNAVSFPSRASVHTRPLLCERTLPSPPERRNSKKTCIAPMHAATMWLTNANRATTREPLISLACVEQSCLRVSHSAGSAQVRHPLVASLLRAVEFCH